MKARNPNETYPFTNPDGSSYPNMVYLKNVIEQKNIFIGDHTYYHDFRKGIDDYRTLIAPYLFEGLSETLTIGKFCQIGQGTVFISNSANHHMNGFSTFPFNAFGKPWSELYNATYPIKKDTFIGNDVWFGHDVTVLPSVHIGDGAIIGTRSVVTKDVAPYSIVAGNPARLIRKRFDEETIQALLKIQWWNFSIEQIEANLKYIVGNDIESLKKALKGTLTSHNP